METLDVILDLEQRGFRDGLYTVTPYEGPIAVGAMPKGTTENKPTVMIAIADSETGGVIVIETTLALFLSAGDAFKAHYGDPRT